MKWWLFFCIIYVYAHYADGHLVVLEQVPKNDKSNEVKQTEPSYQISSGEDAPEKSGENGPQELSGDPSSEHTKQSSESEPEKLAGDVNENELSAGTSGGSQSDSDDRSDGIDKKSNEATLFILEMPDHSKDNSVEKARKIRNWNRWVSEVSKGNNAEIMGTNPHTYQPDSYFDLGRRFVPQYPYTEVNGSSVYAPPGKEIVPIEAPKEVVTVVARESALRVASRPKDPEDDVPTKKLLRTGDYWNGVWKEEVAPKTSLRNSKNQILGVVRAKIKPGNEFYDLVSRMKKISPRLLYIINEKKDDY